ncbi:CD209 antigen-like protein C [Ctenodactylus gundi]
MVHYKERSAQRRGPQGEAGLDSGPTDGEELVPSSDGHFTRRFRFPVPPRSLGGAAGCLSHGPTLCVLQLLSLTLFAVVLVVILAKVSKVPSYQEHRQAKRKTNMELLQLKAAVDRLCRPCPWDWTLFQGNCYFFSKSKRNWNDSVTACQEMGAQLVVIKSAEEQDFLQLTSKTNGYTWMGLSDLNQEGTWLWVDGSHLWFSFKKYWNDGEPNNIGEEDCVEFKGNGWNDSKCDKKNFWICKKTAVPCSTT